MRKIQKEHPHQNSLLRLLDCLLDSTYLPGRTPQAVISAHPGLFSRRPKRPVWAMSSTQKSVGDLGFSPGAMTAVATSFEKLRDGIYDLIQRALPPGNRAEVIDAHNHPALRAGLRLMRKQCFGISLAPGSYAIRFSAGTILSADTFRTRYRLGGKARWKCIETQNGAKWTEQDVVHSGGMFVCEFMPDSKMAACPSTLVFIDKLTGATVHAFYFSETIRVTLDYEGYTQVSHKSQLGETFSAADWQEMRTASNEESHREFAYGWLS